MNFSQSLLLSSRPFVQRLDFIPTCQDAKLGTGSGTCTLPQSRAGIGNPSSVHGGITTYIEHWRRLDERVTVRLGQSYKKIAVACGTAGMTTERPFTMPRGRDSLPVEMG
ncbi:uncharacterized protein CIMG_13397 [Coccidioides immitis RS]|uniref:Uncharacterized protein n=1 Tax=Coccidioides immitis (strain RS) TaxID=246410 RepID=A0A0D8JV71_COCIM|nr:uncharacterized protein CIMG_13397 [Coccidioides immitis RS]KJF61054.1 hypothetical protein CIMG_13397 [Coccidioides immitis RS]